MALESIEDIRIKEGIDRDPNAEPETSWGQDFVDAWVVAEPVTDWLDQKSARWLGGKDPNFTPYENNYLKGYEEYATDFMNVQNKAEADALKATIDINNNARARLSRSDRWFPQMLGEVLDPTNLALAAIPGGVAKTFLGTAAKAGLKFAGSEAAIEFGVRRATDPTRTAMETGSYIAGAGVIGGFGEAALRKVMQAKTKRDINQLSNLIIRESGEISNRPLALALGDSEEIMIKIRSSGYDGSVPIFNDDFLGHAAAFWDEPQMRRLFLTELENLIARGVVDESDELVKLVKNGPKGQVLNPDGTVKRAGRDRLKDEEIFDIIKARIKEGQSPSQIFAVRPDAITNPSLQVGLKKFAATAGLRLLRQMDNPLQPHIRMNRKGLERNYLKYLMGNGDHVMYQGLHPNMKTLPELGIEGFTDLNDFTEFVLRHELWHKATAQEIQKPGSPFNPKKWVEKENAANEGAARDYLAWRTSNRELAPSVYQAWVSRMLGTTAGKAFGKTMDAVASTGFKTPLVRAFSKAKTEGPSDVMHLLLGDDSANLVAMRAGRNTGPSVQTGTGLWTGRAHDLQDKIRAHYDEYSGKGRSASPLYIHIRSAVTEQASFTDFVDEVSKTMIMGIKHDEPVVNAAVADLKEFYRWAQAELIAAGLLRVQNPDGLKSAIKEIEYDIDQLGSQMKGMKPSKKRQALQSEYVGLQARRDQLNSELADAINMTSKEYEDFYNRVWDTNAIRAHREEFIDMLEEAFLKQPKVFIAGKWVETNPKHARKRASETVARILNEEDPVGPVGYKPGELRQRVIPLRNSELINVTLRSGQAVDFIRTDAMTNAMHYARSVGGYAEFAKRFKGKGYETPDEVFDRMVKKIIDNEVKAGQSPSMANSLADDMEYARMVVTHRLIDNPARADRHVSKGIRNFTHLTTMGVSGFTAINEFANVILRHGMRDTFNYAHKIHDPMFMRLAQANFDELRRSAAILDTTEGMANLKWGDTPVDPAITPAFIRATDRLVNGMFTVNLMQPITVKLKLITGLATTDKFMRVMAGQAGIKGFGRVNSADKKFVQSLGLNENMTLRIQRMVKENFKDMYDPDAKIFSAGTKNWSDQGAARAYQAVLKNEVENMIVIASNATKWKMMNGVIHIPKGLIPEGMAKRWGMKALHGSYQLESPILGLPFMYMSWVLAFTQKIAPRFVRGEYASPIGFVISSLALAYAAEEMRDLVKGSKTDFMGPGQKWNRAVWRSNLNPMVREFHDMSAPFATAVARDLGAEKADFRRPAMQWMDVQSARKEAFDTIGGVGVSKMFDAGRGIVTGNDPDSVRRSIPFNQFAPMTALIKAFQEGVKDDD